LIDNHEIKDIVESDTENDNKSELEPDRPLLNMEQKQANQENEKDKS
jgi:hypothetical protein